MPSGKGSGSEIAPSASVIQVGIVVPDGGKGPPRIRRVVKRSLVYETTLAHSYKTFEDRVVNDFANRHGPRPMIDKDRVRDVGAWNPWNPLGYARRVDAVEDLIRAFCQKLVTGNSGQVGTRTTAAIPDEIFRGRAQQINIGVDRAGIARTKVHE